MPLQPIKFIKGKGPLISKPLSVKEPVAVFGVRLKSKSARMSKFRPAGSMAKRCKASVPRLGRFGHSGIAARTKGSKLHVSRYGPKGDNPYTARLRNSTPELARFNDLKSKNAANKISAARLYRFKPSGHEADSVRGQVSAPRFGRYLGIGSRPVERRIADARYSRFTACGSGAEALRRVRSTAKLDRFPVSGENATTKRFGSAKVGRFSGTALRPGDRRYYAPSKSINISIAKVALAIVLIALLVGLYLLLDYLLKKDPTIGQAAIAEKSYLYNATCTSNLPALSVGTIIVI